MRPRQLLVVTLLGAWLAAAPLPLRAFRGDGSRQYRLGLRWLRGDAAGEGQGWVGSAARLEQAVRHLERARALSLGPQERARVEESLREALERLARVEEEAGRPGRALEWLAWAGRIDPGDPRRLLQSARLKRRTGDRAGAVWDLERLLERDSESEIAHEALMELVAVEEARADAGEPRGLRHAELRLERALAEASGELRRELLLALGRLRYRRRDHEGAARALEEAAASGPLPPDRTRELALSRTFLRRTRRGQTRQSVPDRHFELRAAADLPAADVEVLRQLFEEAREEIGQALGIFPDDTLPVRLLPEGDYSRVLARHTEAVSNRAGIVLRLRPGRDPAGYRATVFHEYAHHALRAKTRGRLPPRWFDEGLALLLEPGELPLVWYRKVLASRRGGTLPDLETLAALEAAPAGALPGLYAAAALWVEAYVERFGMGSVARVLERVAGGASLDDAVREDTGDALAALHRDWEQGVLEQVRGRLRRERALSGPAEGGAEGADGEASSDEGEMLVEISDGTWDEVPVLPLDQDPEPAGESFVVELVERGRR